MKTVTRKPSMRLQLWVQDTNQDDGAYSVRFDGIEVARIVHNQDVIGINIPDGTAKITVEFGGVDGGTSELVDDQGPGKEKLLASETGSEHAFTITPGTPTP